MKKTLAIALLTLGSYTLKAQVTANQVINTIKKEVNCPWNAATVDEFKAGNPNAKVTGVATTFMATLDVLKRAKAQGLNLVITHEPTFYGHTDDLKAHESDPIQIEKLKFIKDNDMVVWRFHDHLHQNKPDMIYEGFLDQTGWKKYQQSDARFLEIPSASLKTIVQHLEKTLGAKTMRIVGNPDAKFSKIGLVLGAAGSGAHFQTLRSDKCELLIVGESNEWETVPYVQDAIKEGKNKALIVMGHADSEEPGMVNVAKWLKGFYPDLKIEFVKAGNPFWH